MKKLIPFLWCFAVILLIELVLISNSEWWSYRIFSKPLVVGSILVFLLIQNVDKRTKNLVAAALSCGILGDVILIYARVSEPLFIFGVLAFLIGHIFYALQFSRSRNKEIGIIAPLFVLLGYVMALLLYLRDSLYNLAIPVAVYIIVLMIMILFAYVRDDSMTNNSYIYVLAGSLLFMLSNSILAITKFKSDIPYARILVMGIYGLAQLLMVIGIIKENLITESKTL
ncbi:lysoplasmalogenase [Aurantibacter sp.]|uniref:lysoplasmalogenase n=1 Tax=Aurantibacter sp. TaxID=2807103 RepID=UPI0032648C59